MSDTNLSDFMGGVRCQCGREIEESHSPECNQCVADRRVRYNKQRVFDELCDRISKAEKVDELKAALVDAFVWLQQEMLSESDRRGQGGRL